MSTPEYYKSIEQIAAGLAHEVKNPLSLVKANIDLLEMSDGEENHRKSYTLMKRELEKINDLMMDFISFAKPMEGNLPSISLKDVICAATEDFISAYGDKIEFSIAFKGEDFVITGDNSKLERVFTNLIKNAIEAIRQRSGRGIGKIRIYIAEKGKCVEVIVSDNGVGISPSQRERIASPFYTTKKGGSGLGLYISRIIIEEHGGSFYIDGQEGRGCKVTVSLPRETGAWR